MLDRHIGEVSALEKAAWRDIPIRLYGIARALDRWCRKIRDLPMGHPSRCSTGTRRAALQDGLLLDLLPAVEDHEHRRALQDLGCHAIPITAATARTLLRGRSPGGGHLHHHPEQPIGSGLDAAQVSDWLRGSLYLMPAMHDLWGHGIACLDHRLGFLATHDGFTAVAQEMTGADR
jgi:hypothetical protein